MIICLWFSCNKSFQASNWVTPFKGLYDGRCQFPICEDDVVDKIILDLNLSN